MAVNELKSAEEMGIFQSISDEERRKQRPGLSTEAVTAVVQQVPKLRYSRLISFIAGQEEVWSSFSEGEMEGWNDEKTGQGIVPIWPTKYACELFTSFYKLSWDAVPIPIVDWIDEVLPTLEAENYLIAGFPVAQDEVVLVEPRHFLNELEAEWKKFAKSIV